MSKEEVSIPVLQEKINDLAADKLIADLFELSEFVSNHKLLGKQVWSNLPGLTFDKEMKPEDLDVLLKIDSIETPTYRWGKYAQALYEAWIETYIEEETQAFIDIYSKSKQD